MAFTRWYRCDECSHEFKHWHFSKKEKEPDCPECSSSAIADEILERSNGKMADILAHQKAPGVTSHKSKAVDIAYKMAEEDYGMTDMRDNQRAGDIAAVAPPPIQTAEAEAMTRELVQAGAPAEQAQAISDGAKNFWQTGQNAPKPDAPRMMQAPQMAGVGAGAQLLQTAATNPMAVASGAAAQARAEGKDPMALLHDAGKKGLLNDKYRVVASD